MPYPLFAMKMFFWRSNRLMFPKHFEHVLEISSFAHSKHLDNISFPNESLSNLFFFFFREETYVSNASRTKGFSVHVKLVTMFGNPFCINNCSNI